YGDKSGTAIKWEQLERCYGQHLGKEVWTVSVHNEDYPQRPAEVVGSINDLYAEIYPLLRENQYLPDTDVSGQGVVSMLGATYLKHGLCLIVFLHCREGNFNLVCNFNDWQSTYHRRLITVMFLIMKLYRGYHGLPIIWALRTDLYYPADPIKNNYQFLIVG